MNQTAMERLAEQVQRMEVRLLTAAYTDCVGDGWRGSVHAPQRSALYYITKGAGYVTIGGVKHAPRPGQLVLLPYGRDYAVAPHPGRQTFGKYWCCFTAALPEGDFFGRLELPHLVDAENGRRVEALFQRVVDGCRSGHMVSQLEARAAMLELLAEYLRLCEGQIAVGQAGRNTLLDGVLDDLHAHPERSAGVGELAARAHVHPSYLTRLFRQATGDPPVRYRNRLRVERARDRLAATDRTVQDIASELGLDPVYFARLFRRHTGMSPSEYRRLAHQPDNSQKGTDHYGYGPL